MERVRDQPLRSQRVAAAPAELPSPTRALQDLAEAERAEGWLARCEKAGRYVVLTERFVEALAGVLRRLGGPVVEICAGDGSLADALRARDIRVHPTDLAPSAASPRVERATADAALRRYRPPVVLGSFVPVDSGVDRRVLWDPYVRHYVVLNARLGGAFGAYPLWHVPGWTRVQLEEVTAEMITRHDVWRGDDAPVLRHGEAWLLSRDGTAALRSSWIP